jgi:hypothetical protein
MGGDVETARVAAQAAEAFANERMLALSEVLSNSIFRLVEIDRPTVLGILCAIVDDLGAGIPNAVPLVEGYREDAAFWADTATQPELEAYVAAGLRAIERTAFAVKPRKRLLVSLWDSLPDDDRKSFLRAVDPSGKFARRAA